MVSNHQSLSGKMSHKGWEHIEDDIEYLGNLNKLNYPVDNEERW